MIQVNLAQAYVLKLAPGPVRRQNEIMSQVALNADGRLVTPHERVSGGINFSGLLEDIEVGGSVRAAGYGSRADLLRDSANLLIVDLQELPQRHGAQRLNRKCGAHR